MGDMKVPREMLYGASTQRAALNFPVSGRRFSPAFIRALAQIKLSAAKVNQKLKLLAPRQAKAIIRAAEQVKNGRFDAHFVLDIFQTGSATSTNMNANEVIATLANRSLGVSKSSLLYVHPNNHVNKGQSSNDVIPSAIHISTLLEMKEKLVPELRNTYHTLLRKSSRFASVYKIGRTHLQDATPVTLGQEFGGYAEQVRKSTGRLEQCYPSLRELAIGGTAVGTGINTHPRFAQEVCLDLSRNLGEKFFEARDHFEAQSAKDACVETSGQLRSLAVSLTKMANDIRWLGSGPRGGFAEIKIPAVQPGSSIMPGKVNPVMAEAVLQVAAEVIGSDVTVAMAGQSGNFELNVMMPVIAYNLLESIRLLTNVLHLFRTKCLDGIEADRQRCESLIEKSLMLSTPLVPFLGYDKAAELAKAAYRQGKTIREVVLEKNLIPKAKLDAILNVKKLI
ncbi:MAG: class II fumarate hydratase [Candidatus Omnitrophica bacterium]|nr:class II fumarate hydratase [Candidatus Omnitrophota bacterium]